MITIVTVDEAILDKAARVAGIKDKTSLVRRSLETLIAAESARRLAALGGSEKQLTAVPRRRSEAGKGPGAGLSPDQRSGAQENRGAFVAGGGGNGR